MASTRRNAGRASSVFGQVRRPAAIAATRLKFSPKAPRISNSFNPWANEGYLYIVGGPALFTYGQSKN
jgi:hypothetical protein